MAVRHGHTGRMNPVNPQIFEWPVRPERGKTMVQFSKYTVNEWDEHGVYSKRLWTVEEINDQIEQDIGTLDLANDEWFTLERRVSFADSDDQYVLRIEFTVYAGDSWYTSIYKARFDSLSEMMTVYRQF